MKKMTFLIPLLSIGLLIIGIFFVFLFLVNSASAMIRVYCDLPGHTDDFYDIAVKGVDTHQGNCGAHQGTFCWVEDCYLEEFGYCVCATKCNDYTNCTQPQWINSYGYGFCNRNSGDYCANAYSSTCDESGTGACEENCARDTDGISCYSSGAGTCINGVCCVHSCANAYSSTCDESGTGACGENCARDTDGISCYSSGAGTCINGVCCVPSCAEESNTCVGSTCSDGCGGTCIGLKCPSCPDPSDVPCGTQIESNNGCGAVCVDIFPDQPSQNPYNQRQTIPWNWYTGYPIAIYDSDSNPIYKCLPRKTIAIKPNTLVTITRPFFSEIVNINDCVLKDFDLITSSSSSFYEGQRIYPPNNCFSNKINLMISGSYFTLDMHIYPIQGLGGFSMQTEPCLYPTRYISGFYNGAITYTPPDCTSGDCCDVAAASFRPNTYICRPSTGPDDPAERCTGFSNHCPISSPGSTRVCFGECLGTGTKCPPGEKCFGGICSIYTLSVNKTGNGKGRIVSSDSHIVCGDGADDSNLMDCSWDNYTQNMPISITATPLETTPIKYRFEGWSGACSGNSPTCSIIMNSPKYATANFSEIKMNGSCGDANRTYDFYDIFPGSYNYCSSPVQPSPIPRPPSAGGSTSWNCSGLGGGLSDICYAKRNVSPIIKVCPIFNVSCTSNTPFVNSIMAYIDNTGVKCESKLWQGNNAIFSCNAITLQIGNTYDVVCAVNTSRSYAEPGYETNPIPIKVVDCLVINASCGNIINNCTNGTFLDTQDNSTHYLWNCTGYNGGNNVSCSISKPINAQCNLTNKDSCINGTFLDTQDNSTHYLWNCTGLYGGTNTSCDLPKPINAQCDPTNKDSCINGTFLDTQDNSTHYLWNCTGLYGGTNSSCNLLKFELTQKNTFRYDFQPTDGILQDEWTEVNLVTYSEQREFGWNNINNIVPTIGGYNTGASTILQTKLFYDYHRLENSGSNEFIIKVNSSLLPWYKIWVYTGSQLESSGPFNIVLEKNTINSRTISNTLSTSSQAITINQMDVNVSDGYLNIFFDHQTNVALAGIEVKNLCGDGITNIVYGESCDNGTLNSNSCFAPAGGSCDYCDIMCQAHTNISIITSIESCNNGSKDINIGEQCDMPNYPCASFSVCINSTHFNVTSPSCNGSCKCVNNMPITNFCASGNRCENNMPTLNKCVPILAKSCYDSSDCVGNTCCYGASQYHNGTCIGQLPIGITNTTINSDSCLCSLSVFGTFGNICDNTDEFPCWDSTKGDCCGNEAGETWNTSISTSYLLEDILVEGYCNNGRWLGRADHTLTYYDIWAK